jgi:hypothetical protein
METDLPAMLVTLCGRTICTENARFILAGQGGGGASRWAAVVRDGVSGIMVAGE